MLRVYLTLEKVADTPIHNEGGEDNDISYKNSDFERFHLINYTCFCLYSTPWDAWEIWLQIAALRLYKQCSFVLVYLSTRTVLQWIY